MLPILGKNFWEKQLALVALMVGASFTQVSAQTFEYRAVKSGDWNVPATWEKREVGTSTWGSLGINEQPNYLSGPITIGNGHTVTVSSAPNATYVDQLTIESGATLAINFGTDITVNDGAGTDVLVYGTIVAKGRGGDTFSNIYKTVTSADITFAAGSVYKHEYQANPGNSNKTAWGIIPLANWDANSTVEINLLGATLTNTSVPQGTNLNQDFGNLKWYTPNLTENISLLHELDNVQGNLEIVSTGTGNLIFNNQNSHNYTLTVGKDFKILNTSKVIFAASSNPTNVAGTFNLNIGGGLEIPTTAAFTHNRDAAYPLKVTFTGTGVLSASTSTATGVVLRNMDFEIAPGANITLGNPFAIGSPRTLEINGTLNTENHAIIGGGNVALNGGASFGIGSPAGLNGNLSIPPSNFLPSLNATFIYNGDYAQATGGLLPSTIGNLVIDNAGNRVELSNNLSINGSLALENGVLFTTNRTLTLIEGPALSVTKNAANNSYIDGTIRYEVSTGGEKTLLFPIGKDNVYRPIVLTLTQSAGFASYTNTQTESALNVGTTYPGEIESVSSKRHYTINKTGAATVTNAFVTLSFNSDEVKTSTEMRIIKSNGNAWVDLGGVAGTNNTVKSTIPFTTFSTFAIGYKTVTPLPVELIAFKAEKAENAVNVTWATASEKSNAYFSVERSADGKNFTAIGQVEGNGTSNVTNNYVFADKNPLSNISYYRLKQVDFDGTFEYSPIVKVQMAGRNVALSLNAFPNPTADKINLQVAGLTEAASLQVFDLAGRVVTTLNLEKGTNLVAVDLAKYPAGIYQVKLVAANGTTFVKVIKN